MSTHSRAVLVVMAVFLSALSALQLPTGETAGANPPPTASIAGSQRSDPLAMCPYLGITAADLARAALRESDLPGYTRDEERFGECLPGELFSEFSKFATLAGYRVDWVAEAAASPQCPRRLGYPGTCAAGPVEGRALKRNSRSVAVCHNSLDR